MNAMNSMNFKTFLENQNEHQNQKYSNGVYISVKLTDESSNQIKHYLKKYLPESKELTHEPNLHVTIIYSAKEHTGLIETKEYKLSTETLNVSKFGDAVVIELKSDELQQRYKELTNKYNFISDYPNYKPHCTIAYTTKNLSELPDLTNLGSTIPSISVYSESIELLTENTEFPEPK